MAKWIIFFVFLLCINNVHSQTWERAFGFTQGKEEDAFAICKLTDGNFIVGGEQEDLNIIISCRIIKVTPNGDSLWSKSIFIPNTEQCQIRACYSLSEGGFIIAGGCLKHVDKSLYQTCFVGKLDNNGNVLWLKEYSANYVDYYINEIIEANDGGLLCESPIFLMKIDDNGNYIWHKLSSYYGNANTYLSKFLKCSNDCYIGAIQDTQNSLNYIAKLSNTGEIIWKKQTTNYVYPELIILNSDRIFALGAFRMTGTNYLRLVLQTYDTSGNYIQTKTNIIERYEVFTRNFLRIDTSRFLFSTVTALTLDTHYCVSRILDTNLNILKTLKMTTFAGSRGIFSSILNGKYIYCAGYYRNLMMGGDDDFYVVKTDTNLNLLVSIGIKKLETETPDAYSLYQNYPNPFNPFTGIKFTLPEESFVKIEIFDITGRLTDKIVEKKMTAGTYEAVWNGTDKPSGIYFCKMTAGKYSKTIRMVMVK